MKISNSEKQTQTIDKWQFLLMSGAHFLVGAPLDEKAEPARILGVHEAVEVMAVEQRFLLRNLRMPIQVIEKINEKRKATLNQLSGDQNLKVKQADRKKILRAYVYWLQCAIGSENYSQLVDHTLHSLRIIGRNKLGIDGEVTMV